MTGCSRAAMLAAMILVPALALAQGADWPAPGGDLDNQRFSSLASLNPDSVKRLGGAWATSLNGAVSKSLPVVVDGTIFLSSVGGAISGGAGGSVIALDAKSGAIRWTWSPEGTGLSGLNKGVAVAGGLVYVGLANCDVAAIDQKTGKLVWRKPVKDDVAPYGEFIGAAPVVADGKLIIGVGSGDAGIKGTVIALDAKSGARLWRFNAIPGPGEPGHDTWPRDTDAWQRGGAGIWANVAVDAGSGLVLFGTGNAFPQYAGELRPGDNLYSASVVAVDLKTGKYRWHYQTAHHEIWEADLGAPMVLYDAEVAGKPVKAVAALRTDGFLFLLDRLTGKPVFPVEERPVKQNARLATSPTQPFPVGADQVGLPCVDPKNIPAGFVPGCFWEPVDYDQPNLLKPSAVRFAPVSYSPQKRLFYVSGGVGAGWLRRAKDPYFFNFGYSAPGITSYGLIAAVDAKTHKIVWQQKLPRPVASGSGTTVTAGGVLLHGGPDGLLRAFDAGNGAPLWEFQTGAAIATPVVTYEIDGQPYVFTVANDTAWAFKAGGAVAARPAPPTAPSTSEFSGRIVRADKIAMSADMENMGSVKEARHHEEYIFKPGRVRVKAGTQVTWTNDGAEPHEAKAADGSWTTGKVAPGGSATVSFDKPGTYTYLCPEHPWTLGQLIVEE